MAESHLVNTMEYKYFVVEFLPDPRTMRTEVDVVPSKWWDTEEVNYVFWPSHFKREQAANAQRNACSPESTWKSFPIKRVMFKTSDWDEAQRKCNKALLTSDLDSDINAPGKRKTCSPNRYTPDEGDHTSTDDESEQYFIAQKKKRNTPKQRPPQHSKMSSSCREPLPQPPTPPSQMRQNRDDARLSSGRSTVGAISSPPFHAADSPRTSRSNVEYNHTAVVEKVFTSLEKINEQLREQGQQLKRIEERQMRVAPFDPGALGEEAVDEEDCQIFCNSRGDLIALEQKLSENELVKRRVIHHLGLLGGKWVRETVRVILNNILSYEVSLKYTRTGTATKFSLEDHSALMKVIKKSVRRHKDLKNSTDQDINEAVTSWFTGVRDRRGGRSKRMETHHKRRTDERHIDNETEEQQENQSTSD